MEGEVVDAKEEFRKLKPVEFLSTIWRHSRKWAIPIPKGTRELLDPNQLYEIEIRFTRPRDRYLEERLGGILRKIDWDTYREVTKIWQSGNRRLFPITPNTAQRLVPKLQELKEATELIIEEITIEEAINYLIKKDPRYKELKRELYRLKALDFPMDKDIRKMEKIEKAIVELMDEYRPKAEELVAKGEFKPGTKVAWAKGWIKAPLLIIASPYKVEDHRKAIALYKRAPMPLDEEEYF